MPSSVVIMKPRCCAPGMMARAIKPTMKPTMMDQMMCSIDVSVLDADANTSVKGVATLLTLHTTEPTKSASFTAVSFGRSARPKLPIVVGKYTDYFGPWSAGKTMGFSDRNLPRASLNEPTRLRQASHNEGLARDPSPYSFVCLEVIPCIVSIFYGDGLVFRI